MLSVKIKRRTARRIGMVVTAIGVAMVIGIPATIVLAIGVGLLWLTR